MTGAGNVFVIINGQNFVISGDTGNLIGYVTINSLQTTGSTLDNKINSLSGYSNNTFSTINNLQNTGQQNYNLIIGLSGALNSSGSNLQSQINNLYSKDNSSGFLNFAVTGISITGGLGITGGIIFTGIGGFNIIQSGNIINFSGGGGGGTIVNNSFYVNSGSGLFVFQTPVETGISQKFINFPTTLNLNPTVTCSLNNSSVNNIISYQLSGTTTTGYWLLFSNIISHTGYIVNTFAANSTGTGLATTVIINNNIASWNTLIWNNPVIWNASQNIVEDRQILNLTGSTILNISGLYNGWAGTLKVKQQFSGFTLGLPSGAKVINSGLGSVILTTGKSGAIDVLGFEFDGTDLMVAIGNNFN